MKMNQMRRLATDPEKLKTETSTWKLYTRLFSYIWKYRIRMFVAFVAIAGVSAMQFLIPQVTAYTIDVVIQEGNFQMLIWVAVSIVCIAILLGLFNYTSSFLMSQLGQLTIYDLRNALYRHLQRLSMRFFDNRRTGELMSRVTNDVNGLQQLISNGVVGIFKDILVFVVIAVYIFFVNWQMALLILATFPFMIIATKIFGRYIRHAFKNVQEQAANVNDHLQTTISSIKLIKSYANEHYETEQFQKHNFRNREAHVTAIRYWAGFGPTIDFFNFLGLAIVISFGAYQVMTNQLDLGVLVAFTMYLNMMQQPVRHFSRIINIIQQGAASAERIFEIMDTKPDITEKEDAYTLPPIEGNIQFEHVHFSYQSGEPVLRDFNLTMAPGMMVALVGPSGAGKSTVANLIARFYDPQHGSITIDGHHLQDVTLDSLRGQMSIVTQEIMLFNGTIRDNIAYSKPDASDGEIVRAAQLANAHTFISAFPEGYHSPIGERGVKLSGGQRQRISIARALLKNPRFLVLDEATSALDTESEHLIQEALDTLLVGRTCLVIAHRLSTIRKAHNIIVLENGRMVESGTHEELMAKNGRYAKLNALQFADGQISKEA